MRKKIQTKMLIALFVVMTFATAPLSALGQKTSPVAPTKAQVEAVVREAYEKFKNDAGGKNAEIDMPIIGSASSSILEMVVLPAPDGEERTIRRPRRPRFAGVGVRSMAALASHPSSRQATL